MLYWLLKQFVLKYTKKQEKRGKIMNILKRKNGITLIALVVTIVILIILTTISINAIFGENGLIGKAKQAKELMQISSRKRRNRYCSSRNDIR